ncbi:MAG: 4-(cytidine 5'-diphospho)-2-C-methyl-D-erythritol kinase [Akkermansiaceae bacterium]|nr:4-(cytidine 5'-diphospho)-2-C-methyl-D-erythritol kinase [Akkermansiaceae bacterium]
MNSLTLHAPAKVNLSLRILGKRGDGFHELDTLMVKLPSLADEIQFDTSHEFSFACDDPSVPSDERNLVVKAVRQFQEATGLSASYRISLRKTIPHGAGLGGGSSDAASTLFGLNRLHANPLNDEKIQEIASSLGSDVPFFLLPGAAHCTGRGEKITPAPAPEPFRILLLKPAFGVPTPDAYRRWSQSQEIPGIRYAPQDLGGVQLTNDLERPVFEKHRFLAELKQWLLSRNDIAAALLCGSGSTIFAALKEGADAKQITQAAQCELDPGLWAWSGLTG